MFFSLSLWIQVNEFLAGAGTDAPEVDEENMISRPSVSYDDMWAKTLLESSELEVRIKPDALGIKLYGLYHLNPFLAITGR